MGQVSTVSTLAIMRMVFGVPAGLILNDQWSEVSTLAIMRMVFGVC